MLIDAVRALLHLAQEEQGLLCAPALELSSHYTPQLDARCLKPPASGWAPLARLLLGTGLLEADALGFIFNAPSPERLDLLDPDTLSAQLLYTLVRVGMPLEVRLSLTLMLGLNPLELVPPAIEQARAWGLRTHSPRPSTPMVRGAYEHVQGLSLDWIASLTSHQGEHVELEHLKHELDQLLYQARHRLELWAKRYPTLKLAPLRPCSLKYFERAFLTRFVCATALVSPVVDGRVCFARIGWSQPGPYPWLERQAQAAS